MARFARSQIAAVAVVLALAGPVAASPRLTVPGRTATTGAPTAPAGLDISPTPLAFGPREVGATGQPLVALVTNRGPVAHRLVAARIETGPSDFSVVSDGCRDRQLASGSSCQIEVAFTPATLGGVSGRLVVPTQQEARGTVELSGTGVDSSPPETAWTTPSLSVRVSMLHTVSGISVDNVGVASVRVLFGSLTGETFAAPPSSECDPGERSCAWSVAVPPLPPGLYLTLAYAIDASGIEEYSPAYIHLIVV